jgi:hypothetical protein
LPSLKEGIALNAFPENRWKGIPITIILNELERVAERAGIKIHYEKLDDEEFHISGGHCKLKNRMMVFIDPRAKAHERLRIFLQALRNVDLEGIYIIPAIREIISRSPED